MNSREDKEQALVVLYEEYISDLTDDELDKLYDKMDNPK